MALLHPTRGVEGFTHPAEPAHASAGRSGVAEAVREGEILLTSEESQTLLIIARRALESWVISGTPADELPPVLSPRLHDYRACFVTLTRHGELRGCIGQLEPHQPLYEAVIESVQSASARDPRFSPVDARELPDIRIKLSVLSAITRLNYGSPEELLARLRPLEHGVLLEWGNARATFLPEVWNELPDPVEFLTRLSRKARCAANIWQEPDTVISTYTVQSFGEH